MKKSVIYAVIIILIILFIALFLKMHATNEKYSSEELYNLVQQGTEKMNDMQNVYIERKNPYGATKYYYKGNKMKMVPITPTSFNYAITDLNKQKQYIINKNKLLIIQKATSIYKGVQYDVLDRIANQGKNLKRELSYIKNEKINGKDCIFVKEVTYYQADDGTFISDSESNEDIRSYWIEKSTGFILGAAMIKPTQTEATPESWINNITFNVVEDSDFVLPNGYQIHDTTK